MQISFDPALFIWDETDTEKFAYIYSELAELIIEMIELIDQYKIQPIVNNDFIEALQCSFPYESIYRNNCEFSAYSTSILSFIGKIECLPNNKSKQITIKSHSPALNKPFFNNEITTSIPSILKEIVTQGKTPILISYNNTNEELSIKYLNTSQENHPALSMECDIKCISKLSVLLEKIHGRLYEENKKHNARTGWQSRLPAELSNAELQELLNMAIPTRKGRADLVAFSEKTQSYLRYRPHTKNVFHAYPLSKNELERISGLKIENIPSR